MDKTPELTAEVQELTWALIDEQATDGQVGRLEQLLQESPEARQIYVRCMQLHTDLYFLLGGKKQRLPRVLPKRGRRKTAGIPASLPSPATAVVPLCSPAMP